MNQGIAFARTLRALDADDFGRSKLTLVFAAILLGVWVWWMLAARVPQYETASSVSIQSGRAIAYFPSTNQIRPGQTAFVTLGNDTIPARVQTVAPDHAELLFANNQPTTNNQQLTTTSTPATAEVEISRISPAAIALHTLGRTGQ
jgi:hypothetical protein